MIVQVPSVRLLREEAPRIDETQGRMTTERIAEFSNFCQEEFPRLVGALRLHMRDSDLAEEIAQESLARAWRDWAKLRRLDSPRAWTYRVAFNAANSQFRRRAAERRALEKAPQSIPLDRNDDRDMTDVAAVRSALARIPRRPRIALVLRYFLDLTIQETAQAMGCPEGTVKSLSRRGLALLKRDAELTGLKEVSNNV